MVAAPEEQIREKFRRSAIDYTTFFLGNEIVFLEGKAGMARWRTHSFSYLARNAARPTTFFHIPTRRVVEIGSQISM